MHVEARVGSHLYDCPVWNKVGGDGARVRSRGENPLMGPESDPRPPGPGISLRVRWGWKPLLRTLTSGIWVLSGALRRGNLGGTVGSDGFMGASRHLPHSLGGMPLEQVANVRIRTDKAQLSGHIQGRGCFRPPLQGVEGYRTPDVTLVY